MITTTYLRMWIGSHPLFTVRRPIISPPGYQSPALGESVPTPGLQDHQRVTPYHGVTTSTLSRVPRIFLPVVSQTRTHREDKINTTVSQLAWLCMVDKGCGPGIVDGAVEKFGWVVVGWWEDVDGGS